MFLYVAIGIFSIALLLIIIIIVRSIKKVAKSIIDMQNGVVLEVQDNPVRTVFNAIYNNSF